MLDDVDRCHRLDGPPGNNGCPPRLRADITLRALPTATGIEVDALTVKCPARLARRRHLQPRLPPAGQARPQRRHLPGAAPAAAPRRQRARDPRHQGRRFGAFARYTIPAGNFKKIDAA